MGNILKSLFGGLQSFIASSSATYILLAILGLGGWYMWNDYQAKTKQIGALEASLNVATQGTQEATRVAEQNAKHTKEMVERYEALLQQIQRMEQESRRLQEQLSSKQDSFSKHKQEASVEVLECYKTKLPSDSFGHLVSDGDVQSNGMHNN